MIPYKMRYWKWYTAASLIALIIALMVRNSLWMGDLPLLGCILCWSTVAIAICFKLKESLELGFSNIDIHSHILLLVGIAMNAIVTMSNNGYMPVCLYDNNIYAHAMWMQALPTDKMLFFK